MSDGKGKVQLTLDEGSDAIVERGGMTVQFNANGLVVNVQGATITVDNKGTVAMQTASNDSSSPKATHEIGAIESTGEHKGEIYGGIYPADNKPIWFSAAPKVMDHYKAAAWAEGQGGSLPTRKQGDYLTTLKGKGALKDIFARHSDSSSSAGFFWLAERTNDDARYQQFSDGSQYDFYDYGYFGRLTHLPVLSVRR
jgi:hypothetical protein